MPTPPLDAAQLLDREFLEIRARLLHIAASLDRIDRASGSVDHDARVARLQEGLAILSDGQPDRAERIQLIFSRDYDAQWRAALLPRGANGKKS